ncbi:NAD(P)-dependent dehydrogenase, short-chain alcohol dehydrogenase family [Halobacillus alkaliphilus]|uniref:NAD(P)-dependent dehydrogenase, short-chain alcohol dehydrogenase family n=1 Tax=Halobacillus alkaliphilus TaxID=396056 RepID=A0A1I2RC79_9BACI|nr:SDR family NAD(P)-dependent oxidoreductase [Halobacillus alkaliphilus]SFG38294.1 NAD(P)-dependent dehydrogenase, short-chain alcohol dehydrogenase family [Halobacillus alkaliphilus]
MDNKVCLITGGNSGIGKAAAIQLAQSGMKVIIACRNEERGRAALQDIKSSSHRDQVELLLLDMSSQASIRHAVEIFKSKHSKLDVLIHNAADFDITRRTPEYSEDGTETVWATNHIGPVLLTSLLTNELEQSEQGRVITIASQGLMLHPFLKVNVKDPEFKMGRYRVAKAYYQSKLAQVMYTYWLAEHLKDTRVTVNGVRVTNVKVDISRYPDLSKGMKILYSMKSRFSISPEEMAETYTYLALSPEMNEVTGEYFNEKNEIVSSSSYSKNKRNIEEVMELTMKYFNP